VGAPTGGTTLVPTGGWSSEYVEVLSAAFVAAATVAFSITIAKNMTNRVCTHATCISRVQASVLAICRFVGSGGDQNPQVQTVKLEI
jgi:hypothetical protein